MKRKSEVKLPKKEHMFDVEKSFRNHNFYLLLCSIILFMLSASQDVHARTEEEIHETQQVTNTDNCINGVGLNVMVYGQDPWRTDSIDLFFDRIETEDNQRIIDCLVLVFPIFMEDRFAEEVFRGDETPTFYELSAISEEAIERGYDVLLSPILDESSLNSWRGAIIPGNDLSSTESLNNWFQSYGNLLSLYATFAEEFGVNNLLLGSELVSIDKDLPKYTTRWQQYVINPVRARFSGNIGYGTNWNPGEVPGFAENLDFIGISAYYPLQISDSASYEEVYKAMLQNRRNITAFQEAGVPVIFTEFGLVPVEGSYAEPWINRTEGVFNDEVQTNYYLAGCALASELGISAIHFWSENYYGFFDEISERSVNPTNSFSPINYPAWNVVRDCFNDSVTQPPQP